MNQELKDFLNDQSSNNNELEESITELSEKIDEKMKQAISEGMKFESQIPLELLKKKYLKYKKKYLNQKSGKY